MVKKEITKNEKNWKYFILFVGYNADKAGTVELESVLEDYECESLEEFLENVGIYELMVDGEWYLTNINSVFVAESPILPERLFRNQDLDKGTTYDEDIEFEEAYFEIPDEGLAYVQHNEYLMNAFVVKVDSYEEFDISKLYITNAGGTIIYDGNEYNAIECDGDDNGDVEIYIDGEYQEC